MTVQTRLKKQRQRRKFRVHNKSRRSARGKMRLSIFRSNNHMYAQIIDDTTGETKVAASTLEKGISGAGKPASNRTAAEKVGKLIAERATEQGIKEVCFDRGAYRFLGRVASLANAARANGLEF